MKNMKPVSIKTNAILNVIRKIANILFPLLTYPYVSRVLEPDNYGKFSFANSIISYFLLFSMLGIETYVIREGSRIRDDSLYYFGQRLYEYDFRGLFIYYSTVYCYSDYRNSSNIYVCKRFKWLPNVYCNICIQQFNWSYCQFALYA